MNSLGEFFWIGFEVYLCHVRTYRPRLGSHAYVTMLSRDPTDLYNATQADAFSAKKATARGGSVRLPSPQDSRGSDLMPN